MPTEPKDNPATPSSDFEHMAPYWTLVSSILGGVTEMRKPSAAGTTTVPGPQVPYQTLRQLRSRVGFTAPESPYLPAFENETPFDYVRRRTTAPMTNIYADATDNLSKKPFSKTLELEPDAGEDLKKLAEDIDGQGNSLHVFAQQAFRRGIDYAIHWVLVDYTRVPQGATLADERNAGARPYWVQVPADRVLAAYSVFFGSKEQFYHVRIYEPFVEQDGYAEVHRRRVRIFKRDVSRDARGKVVALGEPYFELWEEQVAQGSNERVWNIVDGGILAGMSVIPIVPFRTGEREGTTWKILPPMQDLAHMQVEEFQQESNLKNATEMTAFPMLAGNGVNPKTKNDQGGLDDVIVPVGPKAVLFAPPNADGQHGEWKWIEVSAESLKFLQEKLDKHKQEMRNLGKQPLAEANLTVVTTANVSMKASSAVQAWAILFKDALEQCWVLTCEWLKQKKFPGVVIHTDFGVELSEGKELSEIRELEKQGILSKEDTAIEFKRRGVLRDDFDWEDNQERRAKDDEGLEPEEEIDPATGQPIQVQPRQANGKARQAGGGPQAVQ